MRHLIIFFALFCVAYSRQARLVKIPPDLTIRVAGIVIQCISETGVDMNIMDDLKAGTLRRNEKNIDFVTCGLTKAKIITKEGLWKPNKTIQFFPPDVVDRDEVKNVLEDCNAHIKGKSNKETAFNGLLCFMDNSGIILDV